ncbi:MAG: protoheme IX farnesyltransferase, partial [Chloroflexi bacterium]|nr:protoheme IX farnesyltransferase [Chloroflexota bacterium]
LTWPQAAGESGANESPSLRRWALGGALGVLAVVLSGSYAVGAGAGFACGSWLFCNAGFSVVGELQWTQMAHRILAALVGLLVGWVVMLGWRQRRRLPLIALMSVHVGVLLVAQMLAGALNPWSGFAVAARAVHLSLATALWGTLVVLSTLAWRPLLTAKANSSQAQPAVGSSARPMLLLLRDYVILTKPRVMVLLLITALGGMVLASKGVPSLTLVSIVLGGGVLASGGASALNHFLERDIDQRMQRTQRRPVASQRIRPGSAFFFGVVLNILAFALLWAGANLTASLLALGGSAFYILVYTQWLKRSTAQNIVIGGAAGAVPPLVGWAAVTGGLGLPALYLFAIIFFWTPPHFWALALMLKDDYARAGIPMLPVVSGPVETAKSIMLYALLLVALTLLFFTVQAVGWLYFGAAAALGGVFLSMTWRVLRSGGARGARSLYLYSILYLALLFSAAMVDSILQP